MQDIHRVPTGSRWKHYKHGVIYIVVGHTRDEATGALRVSYVPEGQAYEVPWSRPLSEWLDVVSSTSRYTEIK